MKYLLLAIVIGLCLWLLRRSLRAHRDDDAPAPRAGSAPTKQAPEEMVRCAQCGLVLPRSEALAAGGLHFCGEPHRIAHAQGETPP